MSGARGAVRLLALGMAGAGAIASACSSFSGEEPAVQHADGGTDASAPADASAPGDVSDAAPPSTAPATFAVACGPTHCDASTPVCCLTTEGISTCTTTTNCAVGYPVTCDDHLDCEARGFAAGSRCCGSRKTSNPDYYGTASCKPSCAPDDTDLCDPLDPTSCPPSAACSKTAGQPFPPHYVCTPR